MSIVVGKSTHILCGLAPSRPQRTQNPADKLWILRFPITVKWMHRLWRKNRSRGGDGPFVSVCLSGERSAKVSRPLTTCMHVCLCGTYHVLYLLPRGEAFFRGVVRFLCAVRDYSTSPARMCTFNYTLLSRYERFQLHLHSNLQSTQMGRAVFLLVFQFVRVIVICQLP